jgi:hypothetical protein
MTVAAVSMEWPDVVVIVLYFVIVLGVGVWVSCLFCLNRFVMK